MTGIGSASRWGGNRTQIQPGSLAGSEGPGKGAQCSARERRRVTGVASLTCDPHACYVTPVASVTALISLFFFPEKTGERFVVSDPGRFSFASGEHTKKQRPVIT